MTLRIRVLASCVAVTLVAAACGGTTGDGAAAPTASAAQPAPTQAPQVAKFLLVVGDTIRGNLGLNETEKLITAPGIHCTQQSRFPQGGRIVWRMKAMDPLSGKYLDDKQIKTFTITYPDGKTADFKYAGHGGTKENPQDFLWAVGYTVPLDYPTGAFNVKIQATSLDGIVGVFDQFKVAAAQLIITPAGKDYPRN
jgi:hypothetical protein